MQTDRRTDIHDGIDTYSFLCNIPRKRRKPSTYLYIFNLARFSRPPPPPALLPPQVKAPVTETANKINIKLTVLYFVGFEILTAVVSSGM
jgi:hypothetical protein